MDVWVFAGGVGDAAAPAGGGDVPGGALGVGPAVRRHRARPGAARRGARAAPAAQVHPQPARYSTALGYALCSCTKPL